MRTYLAWRQRFNNLFTVTTVIPMGDGIALTVREEDDKTKSC